MVLTNPDLQDRCRDYQVVFIFSMVSLLSVSFRLSRACEDCPAEMDELRCPLIVLAS